ncbi:molecular chaperone DnaJ [bacterium]|nr:molecular chaperone DnaJ [bacterium]
MADKDFYGILGVSHDASEQDIKQAYRRLVRKYHPDVAEDKEKAQEEMIKVNEAYGVLSDPEKRAYYDRFGSVPGAASSGGDGFGDFGGFSGFSDLGDIFGSFFNMGMGSGRRQARRGRDVELSVDISLQEAYTGCKRTVEYTINDRCPACDGKRTTDSDGIETCPTCNGRGRTQRQVNIGFGTFAQIVECPTCSGTGQKVSKPCSKCNGSGQVKVKKKYEVDIQAGMETGNGVRIPGQGEAGLGGGPNGDVIVFINVKDDPRFKRDGSNLIYVKKLTFTDAALGTEVDIDQVVGEPEKLKIPAGTQSGTKFRIRGKGMPSLRNGQFGDLYVIVQVMIPTKLNSQQKKMLQDFAGLGSQEAKEPSKGFFERIHDAIFNR